MLNYCTDESKASTRNLKTGVVEGPRHGPRGLLLRVDGGERAGAARGDLPDGTFETAQDMTVQEIQSVDR
ncbi:hypothetical protein ACWEV9_01215 [Streptomyces albogriseolus]